MGTQRKTVYVHCFYGTKDEDLYSGRHRRMKIGIQRKNKKKNKAIENDFEFLYGIGLRLLILCTR